MNNIKIRSINNEGVNEVYLDFYASVYEQKSKRIFEDGKLFNEIIKRGAFDNILNDENINVKAVVNHDDNKLLGRSKSGTLKLTSDDYGLLASVRMGNTQLHKDVIEMVERGDYNESSFKFTTDKEYMTTRREGSDNIVEINKITGLYDVSIVGDGAYANTNVSLRSLIDEIELDNLEKERKEQEEKDKEIKDKILNDLLQREYENKINYLKNIKNKR
jgi:HK97 family phage prohead protease